jgi:Ig-like domain from next to BRCA1 gene
MPKNTRLVSILLALVFGISACNLPSNATPTQGADTVLTEAAQTVEANLTQAAILNPPTVPVIATSTSSPPTVTLAIPTNTQPVATNTQICDLAEFIKDVNIPDGTEIEPNKTFTKTWRLKNIGACSWSGYSLVFDSGESMGGPASTSIGTVSPGQEVDLSVDLKSPSTDGTYRGYWRLKNSAGVLIPVSGGYQSVSFYVEIKVKSPAPSTTTITLNATGGTEGGTVYEPAASLAVVNGSILAGDTGSDFLARGYMSFDISSISGKTVTAATLDLSSCSQMQDPFGGSLAGIWLGEVQYALPLDQTDYDVASTAIQLLNSLPGSSIDVKSLVQTRVTEGKSRFQIRLHPKGPSDADGQADYITCGANGPKLTITYQP